jgi:hypothetical protein
MPTHMSATEFIERLADALDSSRDPSTPVCLDNGCGKPIRRGIRCEDCRKKRHAAAERARVERLKRENMAPKQAS